jgi:hypothetical protein
MKAAVYPGLGNGAPIGLSWANVYPLMNLVAAVVVAVFYVLHQDVWFWREARPLVFGFMPIGLFYHAAYTAGCALLLWLMVRIAWPGHLDPSGHE